MIVHKYTSPVIVTGMHRSGTSLLSKALQACGIFMGARRSTHEESIFFLRRNQKIFRLAHANWDIPKPVECLLNCTKIRNFLTESLQEEVYSFKFIKYLGLSNFLRFRGSKYVNHPWGWKDPRNTYTLPLWLDIFVDAKVIHVRRNGIDVAGSLCKREKKRKDKLNNPLVSCRCSTLEGAFDLWVEYEQMGLQHIETLSSNRILVIHYEDFLSAPRTYLALISRFAKVRFNPKRIRNFVSEIDSDRAYAFLEDNALHAFYNKKREHPLMERFYQDIPIKQ